MFAHLHLHTEYSLLDGACRIKPLMKQLKELGMRSCAITDHGVMYGILDFYQAALEAGIHPVIGCEVYICRNHLDKDPKAKYSHLILLCENQKGYQNLSRLVSIGWTEGYYYRPRIDYDLLAQYSEGLIGMSACLSGDIPRLLLDGREEDARQMAKHYLEIFGENNFFIELQDHGLREEKQVMPRLVRLANEMKIPLVCTNDCHYLTREDMAMQEVLICIQTGKTLDDANRMRMGTDQMYVKSEAEMLECFPNFQDAIERTEEIAQRCNVTFDFSKTHLPRFPLPEGEVNTHYLRTLCEEGIRRRYGEDRPEVWDRLNYELQVIESMGYVDYFLIVWDFVHYAKTHGIGVGPGRGSGAGSIVAYSLGITEIEPLRYNLVFERFLNPERISMPDIDCDFDYERRGKVIDYVRERYGDDHVAQIITFGTMAAKAVLRDVGRVMGMSYQQVDTISKMVPFDLKMTLDKALELNPDLKKLYDSEEQVRSLIDMARKLEGMPRNTSTHAAGVLITAQPVVDYLPLQRNDDVITTQFPMGDVEKLGLLKMDFLGLRTLNVIMDTEEMVREGGGPVIETENIPMDDKGVYDMISSGDTDGVFQLESTGMRNFISNMKPGNLEDIIAAISLYRPGPMDSIPRYIQGKQDPSSVKYTTEKLRPILDVTYGCMVYQEQVMQIVRDLAGYSMGRSDLVRRAMAKKKHDVMAKEKEHFIHGLEEDGKIIVPGCVRNGISAEIAEQLFDEMTAFASYAFNKSHAAAYAVVAVQTGWLKLHYPEEFMAAMLNSMITNSVRIAYYIQFLRKRGIPVFPPDVNQSQERFSVSVNEQGVKGVRFGLEAIKALGVAPVETIVNERNRRGHYRDLYDFIERTSPQGIGKKVVENLIRSGAMDSLPGKRSQKMMVFETVMDGINRQKKNVVEGQLSMFDLFGEEDQPEKTPMPDQEEFDARMLLAMEKETTGVYISGHPLDKYSAVLNQLQFNTRFLQELSERPDHGMEFDHAPAIVGGMIVETKQKASKNGAMMAFLTLEDLYGTMEVIVFPKVYERVSAMLSCQDPVLMTGKLSVREDEDAKLLMDTIQVMDDSSEKTVQAMKRRGAAPQPEASRRAPEPEEAPRPRRVAGRRLCLRVETAQMDAVKKILKETPGKIPVVLVEMHPDGQREVHYDTADYSVDEGYDFGALANIIGPDSIVLK